MKMAEFENNWPAPIGGVAQKILSMAREWHQRREKRETSATPLTKATMKTPESVSMINAENG
jgi:hypothetical protein